MTCLSINTHQIILCGGLSFYYATVYFSSELPVVCDLEFKKTNVSVLSISVILKPLLKSVHVGENQFMKVFLIEVP